jgi:capsular polysaccharide biosynthesis protein
LRRNFGLDPSPGPADPAPGRRIYLSRADAGWRRVLNEPVLMAMLAQRGFESVSLAGMSVREQAALFDAAAWIVAPHGAGLANVVFARPGATLLEIFPFSFGTPAFHCVAAAGRLRYGCHVVPQSAVVTRDGVGYDDFSVDPALLAERYFDFLPAG